MPSRSTDRSRTRVEIALRVLYALTWSIQCPHPSIYSPQRIVCPLIEYKLPSRKMVPFLKCLRSGICAWNHVIFGGPIDY